MASDCSCSRTCWRVLGNISSPPWSRMPSPPQPMTVRGVPAAAGNAGLAASGRGERRTASRGAPDWPPHGMSQGRHEPLLPVPTPRTIAHPCEAAAPPGARLRRAHRAAPAQCRGWCCFRCTLGGRPRPQWSGWRSWRDPGPCATCPPAAARSLPSQPRACSCAGGRAGGRAVEGTAQRGASEIGNGTTAAGRLL